MKDSKWGRRPQRRPASAMPHAIRMFHVDAVGEHRALAYQAEAVVYI